MYHNKMWRGFTINHPEGDVKYWENYHNLPSYMWVWTDGHGTGTCLTLKTAVDNKKLTPLWNACSYCDRPVHDDATYCSYSCKIRDCGCKADPSCCGTGQ